MMMPLDAIVVPSNLREVRSRELGLPFDARTIETDDRIILDYGPVMPSKLLEPPSSPRRWTFDLRGQPSVVLSLPADVRDRRSRCLTCRSKAIGSPFDRREIDDEGAITRFDFTMTQADFTPFAADVHSIASEVTCLTLDGGTVAFELQLHPAPDRPGEVALPAVRERHVA